MSVLLLKRRIRKSFAFRAFLQTCGYQNIWNIVFIVSIYKVQLSLSLSLSLSKHKQDATYYSLSPLEISSVLAIENAENSHTNTKKMGHNVRKCTFGQFFEYSKNNVTLNV